MESRITTGGAHHLKLTVTDVERSRDFYTGVLGFDVVGNHGSTVLMSDGSIMIGLAPAPDPERAIQRDAFDENRVGLDHLSFSLSSRDDLDRAARLFGERGMMCSEIVDLGPGFGIYVLMFRDPDNIQLELTAPYG